MNANPSSLVPSVCSSCLRGEMGGQGSLAERLFAGLRRGGLAVLLAVGAITPHIMHIEAAADPIRVRTIPVPLNSSDPEDRRMGGLTFLGGLELRSAARGFGGFSGLYVSPDGKRLIAVSDMGRWLQAELVHEKSGALKDVRNARLTPMAGLDGKPLTGKRLGDAEDLAVTPQGILVSFERQHRVWRYPHTEDMSKAVPVALPVPAGLASVKRNKGLEALVRLPGGALLLLTEESLDADGNIRGWLGRPDARSYNPVRVRRTPPFAVTGAALVPGQRELLILERRFSRLGGLGVKLRLVPLSAVTPGALLTGTEVARFEPSHNIDNFEGINVRPDGAGGALVYLLSDDNFSGFQRTLLFNFRLRSPERDAN